MEAIEAFDAYALARGLPPMIAFNFRRIDHHDPLRGVFDLRVTHWHSTLHGCLWFVKADSEWVRLPKRLWIDRSGHKNYEDVFTIDQLHSERFENSALTALHQLFARVANDPVQEPETDEQSTVVPLSLVRAHGGEPGDDVPF